MGGKAGDGLEVTAVKKNGRRSQAADTEVMAAQQLGGGT